MEFYLISEKVVNGISLKDIKGLRVTFYARVSTDNEEQKTSLSNQIEYFSKDIKSNPNWTYVEGYIDEGLSGSSTKHRKQFNKMIRDAKLGLFDLIITKEVSRFSRTVADTVNYTEDLKKYNVGVWFQSQNLNTYNPQHTLVLNIMASIAQEEVGRLSQRVRWGLKRSVEDNHVLGNNKIIGYKKEKCKLVIVEEEAKFVREVFELYSTGNYGFYKLAQVLFDKGYKCKIYRKNESGIKELVEEKIYGYSTLKHMIENPKYKGYYRSNVTRTKDYKTGEQEKLKKEEWVIRKVSSDIIPPIVSEELWDKCNEILNKRSESFFNKNTNKEIFKNRYTYSGLLWCSEHNVTFQRDTGAKNKKRPTWACGEYRRHHLKGCLSPLIPEDDLDKVFRLIMKLTFSNKEKIIEEMMTVYSSLTSKLVFETKNKELNDMIKEIEKEISVINKRKTTLLDYSIDGTISKEEYKTRNEEYNKEIIDYEKQIDNIRSEQRLLDVSDTRVKEIENKIREQFNFDDNLDTFVRKFVDKVVVSKIDDNRKDIKLVIYSKLGNLIEYERGIISTYDENNNKLELCINDQNDDTPFSNGKIR